jgi:hypothetical protein
MLIVLTSENGERYSQYSSAVSGGYPRLSGSTLSRIGCSLVVRRNADCSVSGKEDLTARIMFVHIIISIELITICMYELLTSISSLYMRFSKSTQYKFQIT